MGVPILGGQSADQGPVREIKDEGPKIRVLYCWNCKTIEELPDFEGRPEDDTLLEIMTERHVSAGVPHTGTLFKIGVKLWSTESVRKQIIKQIRNQASGGLDELDPGYYATKATFYDDAMKCYAAHLRPAAGCPDFRDEKKRLVPNTSAERKDLGLPTPQKSAGTRVYLCDFCPVKSHVVTQQRAAAGMYKE